MNIYQNRMKAFSSLSASCPAHRTLSSALMSTQVNILPVSGDPKEEKNISYMCNLFKVYKPISYKLFKKEIKKHKIVLHKY